MSTAAVTSTSDTSALTNAAGGAGIATQSLDRNAFLNLLVTQLKNQDPMKPMDDSAFIAQLAQFSSLEQMQQVNDKLGTMSQGSTGLNSAYLIGRKITATNPDTGATLTGTVSALTFDSGKANLQVGDYSIDPMWVTRVE